MEMQVKCKRIERKIGDRIFTGLVSSDGLYKYTFSELQEIGKKILHGDIVKISNKVGLSLSYVQQVVQGKRWNERIVAEMLIITEHNEKHGYYEASLVNNN